MANARKKKGVKSKRHRCQHCDFGSSSYRALEEHVDDKHPFVNDTGLLDSTEIISPLKFCFKDRLKKNRIVLLL